MRRTLSLSSYVIADLQGSNPQQPAQSIITDEEMMAVRPSSPHPREGSGSTPPPQWGRLGGGEQLPLLTAGQSG
ncbi:MAG TPA: hypothetical protein PL105_04370 [Caldilineaceae bacterium]|nr:hypothetical protein [Caldilineaceae bacterium]